MPRPTQELQRRYQRDWVANRRDAWFAENGPCVNCGSWEQLELDHIDPKTKVTSHVWSWSEKRRIEELAKCQVLCSVCHLRKTKAERKPTLIHGTYYGYNKARCRCDACRTAFAVRMRLRRNSLTGKKLVALSAGTFHGETRRKWGQKSETFEKPQKP